MNVDLNTFKKYPNFLLVEIISENLNTTRMNLKDEDLTKNQWSLKRPKVG
jgi:hypothetical protein